jgi:hypothetical protein
VTRIRRLLFVIFISQPSTGDETRTVNRDYDALVALENEWLKNEHNAVELEDMLASDFRHPGDR